MKGKAKQMHEASGKEPYNRGCSGKRGMNFGIDRLYLKL